MYDELTAEREKSISINMPGLMKDVYALVNVFWTQNLKN